MNADGPTNAPTRALWIVVPIVLGAVGYWMASQGAAEGQSVERDTTSAEPNVATEAAELERPASAPNGDVANAREAVDVPDAPVAPEVAEVDRDPAGFLTLRAVDDAGEPVPGVSFEWVMRLGAGGVGDDRIEGVTDERGCIDLDEPPRWWIAAFPTEDSDLPAAAAGYFGAIGVRPTLPFEEVQPTDDEDAPGVHWLDAAPVAGATVDVTLPPFGHVRFVWDEFVGGRGEPVPGYFLHVRRADDGHFPGWRTGFEVPAQPTKHVFGPVGLGWDVYVTLNGTGVLGTLGTVTQPGPTTAGETVDVRIVANEPHRTLAHVGGRAVGPDGQPLDQARLRVAFGDPEERTTPQFSVMTDDEGAFGLELPRSQVSSIVQITRRSPKPGSAGTGALTVDDPSQRVFDLGDVRLTPLPSNERPKVLLAGGRVTLPDGVEPGLARVSVRGKVTKWKDRDCDPEEWTVLESARVKKDGSWESTMAVEFADTTLRVYAYHPDCLRIEETEVQAGTVGVDFTLEKGATVFAKIELEPTFVLSDALALSFRGKDRSHGPSLMDFLGHYRERFSGLTPGTYRLKIETRSGDFELYAKEIDVTGDVDLGTIDLRGELRALRLQISDGAGELLSGGYVSVVDAATGVTIDRSANVDERGRCSAIVPTSIDTVSIGRSGAGKVNVDLASVPESTDPRSPSFHPVRLAP